MLAIGSYLRLGAFGALLGVIAALVVYSFGLHIGPLHIGGQRGTIAARDATIAKMRAAGEVAAAQQMASNLAAEVNHSALRKENDALRRKAYADTHSAVSAYARLHPVRLCPPRGDSVGPAFLAAVPDNPAPLPGPGDPAALVAIRTDELEWLTNGAMRAALRRELDVAQVNDGLAIPEREFGED